MDRATFFNTVSNYPFPGKLSPSQIDGMEGILNEWDKRGLEDGRWLAYILATTFHETAYTMQPIEERGKGKGRPYGNTPYYGRGFVQITHQDNYQRIGKLLHVDLVNHPEKALDFSIATQILFDGMIKGLFTGVGLRKYFNEESDWYNARRIVNGVDKAEPIARYARAFFFAVDMAVKGEQQPGRSLEEQVSQVRQEPEGSELREIYQEFGRGGLYL